MVSKTLSIPRLGVISSIAIIFLGTFIPTKTESAAPVTAGSTSNGVVTVGGLISQLVQHDRMRAISLLEYSANRRYQVTNEKGKLRSEAQVSLQYQSKIGGPTLAFPQGSDRFPGQTVWRECADRRSCRLQVSVQPEPSLRTDRSVGSQEFEKPVMGIRLLHMGRTQ